MTLDLYANYKAFHLRNKKSSGEKQMLHATECLNLMRNLLDKPNLSNAGLLKRAEQKYLLYSQSNLLHFKKIIKAIKSNEYEINRPLISAFIQSIQTSFWKALLWQNPLADIPGFKGPGP